MFYTRPNFSAIEGMMMLHFRRRKKNNDRNRNLAVDRNMVIKKAIKVTFLMVYAYTNEV